MDIALCHYSFHRRWQAEGWDFDRLCAEAAAAGVQALDLHARLGETWLSRPAEVAAALARHRLALAGVSCSNSFVKEDRAAFDVEIERVRGQIRSAAALGARTMRVFGGWLAPEQRLDPRVRRSSLQQVADGLGALLPEAARHGIVLALENHGCLPGTSAEVLQLLGCGDPRTLRATIDLGNFLAAGEEPHHGAAVLAPHGAYVHVKWTSKVPDPSSPWGWRTVEADPGQGDVDLVACFAALHRFGFRGTIAIEYEGPSDERTSVPAAVATVRQALAAVHGAAATAAR